MCNCTRYFFVLCFTRLRLKPLIQFLLCLFLSGLAYSQEKYASFFDEVDKKVAIDSSSKIFISSIQISGNKKTKNYIIQREMRLKTGDSILASTLFEKLKLSRELIYNTTLFTEVVCEPQFISANEMKILVSVKEKWYIYPTPQFQLVDRNFNEWINTFNADFNRVIYGAKFAHYNLSGRRDNLRIFLLTGYARNFSFSYYAPYSNKKLTEGFSIGAGYTQNREISYKTNANNFLLRFSNAGFVRNTIAASGAYIVRKGFYRRHVFSAGYTYTSVVDSVITKYNTSYFGGFKSKIGFPEAAYNYVYIHTDNVKYPLTGKIYSLSFLKRGLGFTGGVNMLSADANYNKYISHGKNWYSTVQSHVKIKIPFELAYINQRAFGFGDLYLRGLENYVIDGVANFLAQYTIKKKLLSFNIPVPIKNRIVSKIPLSIFAKTFADAGYSYSKAAYDSRLGNRFLYTGGFGLDILTLYDISLNLEYSFNQLGEKGIFLHAKGGF